MHSEHLITLSFLSKCKTSFVWKPCESLTNKWQIKYAMEVNEYSGEASYKLRAFPLKYSPFNIFLLKRFFLWKIPRKQSAKRVLWSQPAP